MPKSNTSLDTIPIGAATLDAMALEAMIDAWKPHLRIAVLHGGDPREPQAVLHRTHEVRPWKHYQEVARDIQESLLRSGFRHVITLGEDMQLPRRLQQAGIHLVWSNSAGVQGYGAMCHAAALLESLGVAYVGHLPAHAALLDDKHACKLVLRGLGLPAAPWLTWMPGRRSAIPEARLHAVFGAGSFPLVVKPSCGRGSRFVQVVDSHAALKHAVEHVYERTHGPVLIERYLPGRELCVGVAGPILYRGGRLRRFRAPLCFSHVERLFGASERIHTSLDVAPIDAQRARPLDPACDRALKSQLDRLCRAIHRRLLLRALVRVDLRQDAGGRLHVLEVNAKPDLTRPRLERTSLLALGLARIGMSYDELVLSQLAHTVDHALRYAPATLASLGALLPERLRRTRAAPRAS